MKNWISEKHKVLKDEIGFWRNKHSSGFVAICKVEKNAPAYDKGKYQVQINTPFHLKTIYFKGKKQAVNFARNWMEKHPLG